MYRRIGILGGLSPESTVTYYRRIVRRYQELFGDHGYPEIIVYSVSFQRFIEWMAEEEWSTITEELIDAIRGLGAAGADFAVIATNTMHIVFDEVRERSPIPLISIIEATAEAIEEEGMDTVGLLGTRFTMEKKFYRRGLASHGIETLIPVKADRDQINKVVFEELSRGSIRSESRDKFLRIIGDLIGRGAQGIVLGCTEIPLLVNTQHTPIKLFDTATIHADKALESAMKRQPTPYL
jgi:aspartate racemase